jgi:hypothetical protein
MSTKLCKGCGEPIEGVLGHQLYHNGCAPAPHENRAHIPRYGGWVDAYWQGCAEMDRIRQSEYQHYMAKGGIPPGSRFILPDGKEVKV